MENIEVDADAARQYFDTKAIFVEFERTTKKAFQVRGGMVWKTEDAWCRLTLGHYQAGGQINPDRFFCKNDVILASGPRSMQI